MRLGAQSPVVQTPMKRSRVAGTPRWATNPRTGQAAVIFLTLSAPTCSSWTLAVTCPRSCVAVVQWFGAWYFAVWTQLVWFLACLSLSLPRLSIALVFCLLLLLASLCNFRISKLAWNRGPAAEGFIYIPTTDLAGLERILWERFPVVCGNGSEISVPRGEDVSVVISLLFFYSFSYYLLYALFSPAGRSDGGHSCALPTSLWMPTYYCSVCLRNCSPSSRSLLSQFRRPCLMGDGGVRGLARQWIHFCVCLQWPRRLRSAGKL